MIGTGEEGAGSLRRGTAVDGTTTDQYFPATRAQTNGRAANVARSTRGRDRCRAGAKTFSERKTELRDGLAVQLRRDSCEGPDF